MLINEKRNDNRMKYFKNNIIYFLLCWLFLGYYNYIYLVGSLYSCICLYFFFKFGYLVLKKKVYVFEREILDFFFFEWVFNFWFIFIYWYMEIVLL